MISILLLSLLAAADPQAELTKGIVAFGRGDLGAARKHLDEAEAQTTDPGLLARIHRQRGIIDQVEGKRLASIVSFLRALYFDPKLELSEREHKGEVQQLFACARELNRAGVSERAVEVRFAKQFDAADWRCPVGEKPPPVEPPPPPPPPIAPPPPPPAASEESGSVWTSPWLWVAIGAVVVAGGATTAGILLAGGDDAYGGTTGVNIRLER
jgi:hypothetical protein